MVFGYIKLYLGDEKMELTICIILIYCMLIWFRLDKTNDNLKKIRNELRDLNNELKRR